MQCKRRGTPPSKKWLRLIFTRRKIHSRPCNRLRWRYKFKGFPLFSIFFKEFVMEKWINDIPWKRKPALEIFCQRRNNGKTVGKFSSRSSTMKMKRTAMNQSKWRVARFWYHNWISPLNLSDVLSVSMHSVLSRCKRQRDCYLIPFVLTFDYSDLLPIFEYRDMSYLKGDSFIVKKFCLTWDSLWSGCFFYYSLMGRTSNWQKSGLSKKAFCWKRISISLVCTYFFFVQSLYREIYVVDRDSSKLSKTLGTLA